MSKIKVIISHIWEAVKKAFASIAKLYKWMRVDGMLHCTCSAIIYLFLAGICNPAGAAAITLIIGFFKEVYDLEHGGCSEWHDIICDSIGIALGILIYLEYTL